jgi:hypothetical protein
MTSYRISLAAARKVVSLAADDRGTGNEYWEWVLGMGTGNGYWNAGKRRSYGRYGKR